MNEFILSLIKYTAIFLCMIYAYMKLERIKPTIVDLFTMPLFIILAAILSGVKGNAQIFVPIGFLIFGIIFLLLRFKKPIYETVTVGTVALGFSLFKYSVANIICYVVAVVLELAQAGTLKPIFAQALTSICQIVGICLIFKIKRFQSGIIPKNKNASFDVMLYLSVLCIFTMTLLYADNVKEYMLKVVMLVIILCGLLLVFWCRKHITYNYLESNARQRLEILENELKERKLNYEEIEYQLNVYAKQFHYLNKTIPACIKYLEQAAVQAPSGTVNNVLEMMRDMSNELKLTNQKCSLSNLPLTGVREIDIPILELYNASEQKNVKVSTFVPCDIESKLAKFSIDKKDIQKLLLYLNDNAVLASLELPHASVHMELCESNEGNLLIRIYDSGKQFDEKVISKLGKEQITTRTARGGSGIGLYEVFSIIEKYRASFILDETTSKLGFTKCIEIAFDGQGSITVRTNRDSISHVCADRTDLIIECPDEAAVCDASIAL